MGGSLGFFLAGLSGEQIGGTLLGLLPGLLLKSLLGGLLALLLCNPALRRKWRSGLLATGVIESSD